MNSLSDAHSSSEHIGAPLLSAPSQVPPAPLEVSASGSGMRRSFWSRFSELDRWSFFALLILLLTGVLVSFGLSPEAGERLAVSPYFFAVKHTVFACAAFAVLCGLSFLNAHGVRRLSLFTFVLGFACLILTVFLGEEYNGSARWLDFGVLTVQPSEFIKPSFAVIAAWLIAGQCRGELEHGLLSALVLYVAMGGILLLQPDVGQAVILGMMLAAQWFIAGMPVVLIVLGGVFWCAVFVLLYLIFPHVSSRVDRFFFDDGHRQVDFALQAFESGGFLGQGIGAGVVRHRIFDVHSDFVFAAIGEDFGVLACIVLILCYVLIACRSLWRSFQSCDLFAVLAVAGLIVQFVVQAFVNMGSVSGLIPPKGTVLPFLSAGGSAMLSTAYAMACVLALTRARPSSGAGKG